jgi:hypothetical protein
MPGNRPGEIANKTFDGTAIIQARCGLRRHQNSDP